MKKVMGLILVFFMILINMYIGFDIVYALGVSSEIKNNGFVELLEDNKNYPTIENKLEVLKIFFKQNFYDNLTDKDKNEIKFTEREYNFMLKHVMAMTLYNFLKTLIEESTFDTNAKDIIEKWENKKDKTKLINGIIRIFIDCFENTDLLNILKQDEVMELLNKLIDKKDEDFEKETIDLIKKSENKNHNYKVCIFRLFNKQIINKQNKINKGKKIDKEIDKFLNDDTLILNIIYDSNFENDIDTILQDKLTERKEKVENEYKDKDKDLIKKLCPIVQNFTDNGKQEFLNKKEKKLVASLLSNDKYVKYIAMKAIAEIILSIKDNTIKQKVLDRNIVIELKKQIIDQINNNQLTNKNFLKFMEQLGDIIFTNEEILEKIIKKTDRYTWKQKAFLDFIEKFNVNQKTFFTDKEIFKQIIWNTDSSDWDNKDFLKFIVKFKVDSIFTDKEIFNQIIKQAYYIPWKNKDFVKFMDNFKSYSNDLQQFKKDLKYKVLHKVYRIIVKLISFNLATGITRLEDNTVYVKNPFDKDKEIAISFDKETNLSFKELVSITKTKIISDNKTVLAELAVLEWANKNKYADNSWTRELGYQESIKTNWKNLSKETQNILIKDLKTAVKNDPVIETIDAIFDNISTERENIVINKLFEDVKTLLDSNKDEKLSLSINGKEISTQEIKEILYKIKNNEILNENEKNGIREVFKLFSKIGLQTAINSIPQKLDFGINDLDTKKLSEIDVLANIGRAIRSAA